MTLEEFDVLEEKVNQLLERYSQVKREKEACLINLEKKETEISSLQEKVRVLEQEKETIKARLDRIIGNLENISLTF